MDKLNPFQRKIEGFVLTEFKGGTKFRNGDTLLARITPCLENGKTAQVSILNKNEVGFGSTEFIVLREKPGLTVNDFIYYLSISPEIRNISIKSMTGSSGRQRAQIDVIQNKMVLLPPLEEQKSIANILSSLDEKIEMNSQINKKLEEMAQAIFKQWFVDCEFPNEEGKPYKSSGGEMVASELGMIPKGWEDKVFYDLCEYINGTSFKKVEMNEKEGVPIIKIAELKQGLSDATKYFIGTKPGKYYLNNGDILFSWSGNPETSIDIFIWSGGEGILNQHIFKIEALKYSKEFMYVFLKYHKPVFTQIASNKQTTGLGHVTISDLKRLKMYFPNDRLIHHFTKIIRPLVQKIHSNDLESNSLKRIRDTLLSKLISGEIRVPVE